MRSYLGNKLWLLVSEFNVGFVQLLWVVDDTPEFVLTAKMKIGEKKKISLTKRWTKNNLFRLFVWFFILKILLNLLKWDGGVSTYAFDDILLTGDEGGVGESKLIIDMSVMNVKCFVLISEQKNDRTFV